MTLGPHVIQPTAAAMDWARRALIVKAMNRIDALQAAPANAIRIFRCSYPNEGDTSNPTANVNQIIAALKGYRHPNLYIQIWCGAHPSRANLTQAVNLLHSLSYLTVGSSWFTGDYTQADWDDATAAGVDAYAPQCYWGTQGFTLDHALRYRQYHKAGQKPVMILECGRDKVEGGKGGWRADGISIEQFAAELTAYDAEITKDTYVIGATPFTSGPTIDWEEFDMDPISAMLTTTPPSPVTTGGHRMIPGIDVSNHQGTIDWPLVARCGPQFAVIKASESTDYLDPFFAANWQKARDNGLVRGAYGFGRPSRGSGHADANYFLSVVKDIQQGDFLVLDLEDEKVPATADLLAYALDWLRTVEAAVGFKPMLYSGHYYLAPHNCEGHADLAAYGLWLASYQSTLPPVPKGWDWFAMWQYYDKGVVPGITGQVDQNLFNGSLDQLRKYGKP